MNLNMKLRPKRSASARAAIEQQLSVVVWQWEGDDDDYYHDFDDSCRRLLESDYINGKVKCQLPSGARLPGRKVNLQEFYLLDEKTHLHRKVLRLVQPDHLSEDDGASACWQWHVTTAAGSAWVLYNDPCTRALEAALQECSAEPVDLQLIDPGLLYFIDVTTMFQTNKQTGFSRRVRRFAVLPPQLLRSGRGAVRLAAKPAAASQQTFGSLPSSGLGPTASGSMTSDLQNLVGQSASMASEGNDATSHLMTGLEKFVEVVLSPDPEDVCPICMEALDSPSAYADPPSDASSAAADTHAAPVAAAINGSRAVIPTSTGVAQLSRLDDRAPRQSYRRGPASGNNDDAAGGGSVGHQQMGQQAHQWLQSVEAVSCVVRLKSCKHQLHMLCLTKLMDRTAGWQQQAGNSEPATGSITCPTCNKVYGKKMGTCPKGTMNWHLLPNQRLAGYEQHGVIEILYDIQQGLQGPEHPQPGRPFFAVGFPRVAYLPDSEKGRLVLKLLQVAFDRRLTFTVGVSATSGSSDVVTWNEIHHKTQVSGSHGYPDAGYLDRVIDELQAFGITKDDLASS